MTDSSLRNLERAYRESPSDANATAYLEARMRVEPVPLRQLLESAVRMRRAQSVLLRGAIIELRGSEQYLIRALCEPVTDQEILAFLDGQMEWPPAPPPPSIPLQSDLQQTVITPLGREPRCQVRSPYGDQCRLAAPHGGQPHWWPPGSELCDFEHDRGGRCQRRPNHGTTRCELHTPFRATIEGGPPGATGAGGRVTINPGP